MTGAAGTEPARELRRRRRALLRQAHPDAGGSAEAFHRLTGWLDRDRPGCTPVRVHVWRRRHGVLGLLDDLRRARARRTGPGRVR